MREVFTYVVPFGSRNGLHFSHDQRTDVIYWFLKSLQSQLKGPKDPYNIMRLLLCSRWVQRILAKNHRYCITSVIGIYFFPKDARNQQLKYINKVASPSPHHKFHKRLQSNENPLKSWIAPFWVFFALCCRILIHCP